MNQAVIDESGILKDGTLEERAGLVVHRAGLTGISTLQLAVRTGVSINRTRKVQHGLISAGKAIVLEKDGERIISSAVFKSLQEKAVDEIKRYHEESPLKGGISREELRSILGAQVDQRLFASLMKSLEGSGKVLIDKDLVKLAGHQVDLKGDLEDIRGKSAGFIPESSLSPPLLKDVLDGFGNSRKKAQDVISVMLKDGELVKVSEELLYAAANLDRLRKDYQDYLLKEGKANPAGFKEITGLSRKFIIPLMEFFDKTKLTIRVGDYRVLREKAR